MNSVADDVPSAGEVTSLLHKDDHVCIDIESSCSHHRTDRENPIAGERPQGYTDKILTFRASEQPDSHADDLVQDEVQFLVGRDRQLMVGHKLQMAALSPVFKAMFHHESSDSIEIPDIEPRVFAILLRYAAKDRHPRLDDENVWEILKAADKYNVEQLTDLCFTFLLLKHSRRKRSRHLCVVLEMAHHLNYTHHHEQLLHKVKRKAARVLKNQDALAELCQQCMLAIVKADDLVGVDEVLVHDAVLKWTQCECARQGRQSDSWEELRDVAGDLVQHVRYLTFPKHTLTGLRAGDPSSCLLTQKELDSILKGDASYFPPTVQRKRNLVFRAKKKTSSCSETLVKCVELLKAAFLCLCCVVLTVVAAFVIGWVVYSIINSFILAQSAEDIDVGTMNIHHGVINTSHGNNSQFGPYVSSRDLNSTYRAMYFIVKIFNDSDTSLID